MDEMKKKTDKFTAKRNVRSANHPYKNLLCTLPDKESVQIDCTDRI
ncbi:MAG: hypothetical protein KME30_00505 [Iphinoe sp. HA4291-MV1]|jgi:hypothetical protein|nr:hypothetical protein [Iphinoe sp. HA4291-MV1]